MDASRLEHEAVLDEHGKTAQPRFHAFGAAEALDHQVTQSIQSHLETHLARAESFALHAEVGRSLRRRRCLVGRDGRMMLVDLQLQPGNAVRITQPNLVAVNLHRAVAQDVERLRLFNQAARDPLVMVHVEPRLAGIQCHRLRAQSQGEGFGVAPVVALFVGRDSSFRAAGLDHANAQQNGRARDEQAGGK